jgi:hypothetical protein
MEKIVWGGTHMEARMHKRYRYERARARAHSDMADLLPFLRKMACIKMLHYH